MGVLLELARNQRWQPVLLHYSNSGDTAGDKDAVVGYGAVAFYGDEPMQSSSDTSQSLTPEQGAARFRGDGLEVLLDAIRDPQQGIGSLRR